MNENMTLFTDNEMQRRSKLLQNELVELDFSLIFNRPDMYYYSAIGLDGIISVDQESVTRFVTRNYKLAENLSYLPIRKMSSFRIMKNLAKEKQVSKIGLELDLLPVSTYNYIMNAFDHPEVVDLAPILRTIRSVKSKEEHQYLRRAAKQTDDSFELAKELIKPGMSELELASDLERFLRRENHPGYVNVRRFQHNLTSTAYVMSQENVVAMNSRFGPLSGMGLSQMHMNGPSRRKFREGDSIVIDTTGVIEGYTADETRTFFVGKVDQKLLDVYELAKQVQQLAGKIMIEGNRASEVFEQLYALVQEAGYIDHFMGYKNDRVGFIGHGIGIELDELPVITPVFKDELKEGQVIALEPKFIFPELKSGVGIEDDWIVGKNKAEKITHFEWL